MYALKNYYRRMNNSKVHADTETSSFRNRLNHPFTSTGHYFKGCVRYRFASLFFKPKLEHFSNWEK